MSSAWFDSWESLLEIMVTSVVGYTILIVYLRLMGKRATSKMNNFDWIVTVAMGSIFASMVLLKDVTVADGSLALLLLLVLQFLMTSATSRWKWARQLVLAPPRVLYLKGEFLEDALHHERVSEVEVMSAVRESGASSLDDVYAVILEPDATLAVVKHRHEDTPQTMSTVAGFDAAVAG